MWAAAARTSSASVHAAAGAAAAAAALALSGAAAGDHHQHAEIAFPSLPAALVGPATTAAPSAEQALADDAIWLAVPKQKVSHSKKRIKSAAIRDGKRFNVSHWSPCPACGQPKLWHRLCICVEREARGRPPLPPPAC